MKKTVFLLLFMLVVSTGLKAGDEVAALLSIPPDAVALSLGGQNQAHTIGATDIFINPALMSRHDRVDVQFSNIPSLNLMNYYSASVTVPITMDDFVGAGVVGVYITDIQEYDANGMHLGTFSNYQNAVFLSYARSFFPFAVGANLKYVRMGYPGAKQFENSANGFGLDIGMLYAFQKILKFGFIYQNSFDLYWKNDYHDGFPKRLAMGVVVSPSWISTDFFKFLISLEQVEQRPLRMNSGIEITPLKDKMRIHEVKVRLGMGDFDLELRDAQIGYGTLVTANKFFSAGLGLSYGSTDSWGIEVDYSYRLMSILDNQHMITTKFWF